MAAALLTSSNPNRDYHDIDWDDQDNARKDFSMRLANAYLANSWCSDVSIFIPKDDRIVPAHSLILAAASPVLQRFCFGTDEHVGEKVIVVPDNCSTDALMVVLRYIYIGGTAAGINDSNIADVLTIAIYLELSQLQLQCEALVRSSVSTTNVCSIFNAIHHTDSDLLNICMKFMQNHTKDILDNGTAMEMEDAALFKLLAPNVELSISSESDILLPMLKWADSECLRDDMDVTPEHRRRVLGNRVNLIHFGSMTPKEFADSIRVVGKGFFTEEESLATFLQVCSPEKNDSFDPNEHGEFYPFSSVNRIQFNVVEGFLGDILVLNSKLM